MDHGGRAGYAGLEAALRLALRTLEDALRLREQIGTHLRRATRAECGLTMPVVGGVYTGIELAAWQPELAYRTGRRDRATRIGLLEAGPRLLPGGGGWLAGQAAAALERLGVRLVLTSPALSVQQAVCMADNLAAALRGRAAQPFVPRLEGEALSLGPHRGLARVGGLALEDAPAVIVKRVAGARYLSQLGGPALPLFQCARQHLWDWQPQTPPARAVEAERSGRGRDAERAA